MGKEIERYTAEISELEDREMILMEKADGQKKILDVVRAKLVESETAVVEEIEDLADLAKKLKSDRDNELAERAKHAEAVEEEVIDNYNRLFKSKNGMAVVGLVDEVCACKLWYRSDHGCSC